MAAPERGCGRFRARACQNSSFRWSEINRHFSRSLAASPAARYLADRSSSPIPIFASSSRSSCANAALKPISYLSRCAAIPHWRSLLRLRSPRARDPAAIVLILAADHVLRDSDAFVTACAEAAGVAAEGRIVTFGINATTPATSYGYIRPGAKLNGGTARSVEAFVEKPDAQTAGRYVAEHYLWNSGNFAFRADVMLAEIGRLEPEIAAAAKSSVDGLTRDLDFLRLPDEPFRRAPKKSIDYAVMERTNLAAVLPIDCGWSDVGSWSAVWDILDHDANGNASTGTVVFHNSRNSLARSDETILTAVVGLENVVVIATPDAVLVTSRGTGGTGQGTGRAAQSPKPPAGG